MIKCKQFLKKMCQKKKTLIKLKDDNQININDTLIIGYRKQTNQ